MNYFKIGCAIIQLPEYLLSLFNYLKKKEKNHSIYGNKGGHSFITTQYNKSEPNYAKSAKSTVIANHIDVPILDERVNSLEFTVKNIESKLEEIINLISLK